MTSAYDTFDPIVDDDSSLFYSFSTSSTIDGIDSDASRTANINMPPIFVESDFEAGFISTTFGKQI